MLKTRLNGQTWLVPQPDHGEISGYFAAHWGNGEFARPGRFAPAADPERLRSETILGIAQHDNGWWEWEAAPGLSDDGLPMGLEEVLADRVEAMNRWRTGVPRLAANHPLAALLIGYHAHWLYAARIEGEADPAFVHPLFWRDGPPPLSGGERAETLRFIGEMGDLLETYRGMLGSDPSTAVWIREEHLYPHIRLLQLLDGLSLSLCSSLIPPRAGGSAGPGVGAFDLLNVPRAGWEDRVTVRLTPAGDRRIVADPYPFDADPLPVDVPVRMVDGNGPGPADFFAWWHAVPKRTVRFEYRSR